MSRLACAACGAEDQIATVVQPANASTATEALAGLVERVAFHNAENGSACCGSRRVVIATDHVLGHTAMISAGEFIVERDIADGERLLVHAGHVGSWTRQFSSTSSWSPV
jgi:hypothetical protein